MVELTDKSAVSEENQIPVSEDKLKEEQKKKYEELVEWMPQVVQRQQIWWGDQEV